MGEISVYVYNPIWVINKKDWDWLCEAVANLYEEIFLHKIKKQVIFQWENNREIRMNWKNYGFHFSFCREIKTNYYEENFTSSFHQEFVILFFFLLKKKFPKAFKAKLNCSFKELKEYISFFKNSEIYKTKKIDPSFNTEDNKDFLIKSLFSSQNQWELTYLSVEDTTTILKEEPALLLHINNAGFVRCNGTLVKNFHLLDGNDLTEYTCSVNVSIKIFSTEEFDIEEIENTEISSDIWSKPIEVELDQDDWDFEISEKSLKDINIREVLISAKEIIDVADLIYS